MHIQKKICYEELVWVVYLLDKQQFEIQGTKI
jgi:hypothetical protein